MNGRVAAIVNPISGRRNMLPVVREVGRILQRNGTSLDIHVTQGAGEATGCAAGLAPGTQAVLVVGGDGTVCEVINGLMARPLPFVILRTGTENLLARELRMPTEPHDVAHTLLRGRPRPLDVGVVNGRHFLAVTGVGFDAECVHRLTRVRRGHITHGDYFWPVWRTFWAHRFPFLRVEADGDTVFEGPGLALVGVIGQYSIGLRMLAHARPDDGLLDLCVMPCATRAQLLGHAFRALRRRHVEHPGVIYRQGRHIRITSTESVLVEIDGDQGGRLPIECTILPSAARYLAS